MSNQFPKYKLPIHHWDFRNVNGSAVYDRGIDVSNRIDATLVNSPTIVDGKNGGKGLNVSGGNKYFVTDSKFASPNNVTIFARVYLNSLSSLNAVFNKWIPAGATSSVNPSILIRITSAGEVEGFFYGSNSTQYSMNANPTGTIKVNTWHTIAMTADGTTARLYVDGHEHDNIAMPTSISNLTQEVVIGQYSTNYGNQTQQDTMMFDYAMTEKEIRNLGNYSYHNNIEADLNKLCKSWNTLGSLAEINNSIIGPDFTPNGSMLYVSGKHGNAVRLNGASDYVEARDLDLGTTFTIRGHFQIPSNTTTNTRCILFHGPSNPMIWCYIDIRSSFPDEVGLQIRTDPASSNNLTWIRGRSDSNFPVTKGVFHTFRIEVDSTESTLSDRLRLYIDDELVNTGSPWTSTLTQTNWDNMPSFSSLDIGGNGSASVSDGDRIFDNVQCFNYIQSNESDMEQESPSTISGTNIQVDDNRMVLWNKLGNSAQVNESEIGVDGTEDVGTQTYDTCKFGNGLKLLKASNVTNDAVYFPENLVPVDNFTIELWYTRKEAKLANRYNAFVHSYDNADYEALQFGAGDITPSGTLVANCIFTLTNLTSALFGDGKHWILGYHSFGSESAFNSAFPIDTPVHVAMSKSNTTGEIKIFINGVEKTLSYFVNAYYTANYAYHANLSSGVYNPPPLYVGRHSTSTSTDYLAKGVLDNLKIPNYAKTNFSDRIYEEPMNSKDVRL